MKNEYTEIKAAQRERNSRQTEMARVMKTWFEKVRAKRWVGFSWPEDVGGGGGSIMQQVILKDEMAQRKAPPLGSCFMGLAWVGPSIIEYGTPEQKQRFAERQKQIELARARGRQHRGQNPRKSS